VITLYRNPTVNARWIKHPRSLFFYNWNKLDDDFSFVDEGKGLIELTIFFLSNFLVLVK
jgi:hypothetical protein